MNMFWGIIIISIVAWLIGKVFFTLVGSYGPGFIGNMVWGCLLFACIAGEAWILLAIYVFGSILLFKR